MLCSFLIFQLLHHSHILFSIYANEMTASLFVTLCGICYIKQEQKH